MTITIAKEDNIKLRDLLMNSPFNATERSIQYGVQYTLECEINCNVHYSEKKPNMLKVTIQGEEKNAELANLLKFHIETMSIKDEQNES